MPSAAAMTSRMSCLQQALFTLALLAGACNLPIILAVQSPLEHRGISSAIQRFRGEMDHSNSARQADGLLEPGGRRSERMLQENTTTASASADDGFYQNYASLSKVGFCKNRKHECCSTRRGFTAFFLTCAIPLLRLNGMHHDMQRV